uniref:Uncharacterized protein n=1 Tax=Klebsiella pneumoniae TaxID=573 RepID=A0A8B0SZU3_KLEPN|nr:hypothetical protein [Klebsiella pneumoniae]
MQASIVQRYTDSARTQRFALTLRATVGLFECDNCHHVIPIEREPTHGSGHWIGKVTSHWAWYDRAVDLLDFFCKLVGKIKVFMTYLWSSTAREFR